MHKKPEDGLVTLGKHFVMDFISSCPYDLLVKTAGGSVQYQAWLRVPKLLRLHRVYVWYLRKVCRLLTLLCLRMLLRLEQPKSLVQAGLLHSELHISLWGVHYVLGLRCCHQLLPAALLSETAPLLLGTGHVQSPDEGLLKQYPAAC